MCYLLPKMSSDFILASGSWDRLFAPNVGNMFYSATCEEDRRIENTFKEQGFKELLVMV